MMRAHVGHADLRIVARLRQIAGGPAKHRWRSCANRDLMLAAFDALQNLETSRRREVDLIDALELVGDAEAFADKLKRDACAARGRLPAAEEQELRCVELWYGG